MLGRLGWAEILVIVVLVVILFGSAKIPGMMKNLADGINVFKKEMKSNSDNKKDAKPAATTTKKSAKAATKKSVAKKPVKKAAAKK